MYTVYKNSYTVYIAIFPAREVRGVGVGDGLGETRDELGCSYPTLSGDPHMRFTPSSLIVAAVIVAVAVLRPIPVASQSPTVRDLEQRVTALESQIAALLSQVNALQAADVTLQANIEQERADRILAAAALQQNINNAVPQNLLDLASYVSVDSSTINNLVGPHVIFTGVNMHIRNDIASQTTNGNPTAFASNGITNGLGNLIVGYNEYGGGPRNGSHNIVLGPFHGYGSFGGFVGGLGNAILGSFASVSGGTNNMASGVFATVSGGFGNTAAATSSIVP
jgi:hypothetical protein